MLPAKERAEHDEQGAVAGKDEAPDGLAGAVCHEQRDEVRTACRCARFERDGDGKPRDKASEDDEHDLIVEQRLKIKDAQERGGKRDLHHGEEDEALGDAVPADEGEWDVEREHAEVGGDAHAEERRDAVDEHRDAGEAAGEQVCRVHECLDEKGLQQCGCHDGTSGDDAANEGEPCEFEGTIAERSGRGGHGGLLCWSRGIGAWWLERP